MRIAVLSESSSDEAAVFLLVKALAGRPCERVDIPPLRTRGWPSVLEVIPPVLKALHYRTNADALAVVVDSNASEEHQASHETRRSADCRLCQVREVVGRAKTHLRPVEGRPELRTAVGLAIPSIEAWCLSGNDAGVSEQAWINGLRQGRLPYGVNDLKQRVYSTDRPSLAMEIRCATEAAERLAGVEGLAALSRFFPSGFGALAADVRSWP